MDKSSLTPFMFSFFVMLALVGQIIAVDGLESVAADLPALTNSPERQSMSENTPTWRNKLREEALRVFKDYPDKIPPDIQERILAGEVVLGMAPYDAYLAAGAFAFKVIADPARWKSNADPYKVMRAQSVSPDESQIWMTFENTTQYPSDGMQSFRVFFQGGKALEIEKLTK